MDNESILHELNREITEAENKGDREWLASKLAPAFALQRADELRTVDDREAFLEKVKPGGKRRTISVGPIRLYGDRAVVECVIGVGDREFHNLRLFVRHKDAWKLLGWANEATREDVPAVGDTQASPTIK